MNKKKVFAIVLAMALLCSCLGACSGPDVSTPTTPPTTAPTTMPTTMPPTSQPADTKPTEPVGQTPVDIETIGGVVIVGKIGVDDQGWHIQPEQPLNITYHCFLDNPSVFLEQTRIQMFDPAVDGIEKAVYIGQTVTVAGTFLFYRDDFETLYFSPYTITIGKNVHGSHAKLDLTFPDEPENRYDPDWPLPKYMEPMVFDGQYSYNAFMLSMETIEYMGNDFATFYVGFVDAFLNYKSEYECPNKEFAEMLSTIIYFEFPLYSACAEPVVYYQDYNPRNGTIAINYKVDRETFDATVNKFMDSANDMLANTSPDLSDEENARNIYHAISSRMVYDDSAMEEFERKESYYAYLYNSGVCVTFANVYNQLLTQVGIKTTLAYCDDPDTVGHSWSIITLDGKQYFCDPTYELSYDGGSGYRFFGMNYADRTANGLGVQGIRYGRYYLRELDADMIAEQSLNQK